MNLERQTSKFRLEWGASGL